MLTVDYDQLALQPGERLLDLGCGFGRHAFEGLRRGADVVACDRSHAELHAVRAMFEAMARDDEVPPGAMAATSQGDATALPFPDDSFDRVIASEVLEHIPADHDAVRELARVLRPGGTIAVTVPAWLPERLCWLLSEQYHWPAAEGGHVRIYTEAELRAKLRAAGLEPGRVGHAHALHSPYWWLRCALDADVGSSRLVRAYHRLLVWDIERRPAPTRLAEQLLDPLIGKSLVVYARKPVGSPRRAARHSPPDDRAAHAGDRTATPEVARAGA